MTTEKVFHPGVKLGELALATQWSGAGRTEAAGVGGETGPERNEPEIVLWFGFLEVAFENKQHTWTADVAVVAQYVSAVWELAAWNSGRQFGQDIPSAGMGDYFLDWGSPLSCVKCGYCLSRCGRHAAVKLVPELSVLHLEA